MCLIAQYLTHGRHNLNIQVTQLLNEWKIDTVSGFIFFLREITKPKRQVKNTGSNLCYKWNKKRFGIQSNSGGTLQSLTGWSEIVIFELRQSVRMSWTYRAKGGAI